MFSFWGPWDRGLSGQQSNGFFVVHPFSVCVLDPESRSHRKGSFSISSHNKLNWTSNKSVCWNFLRNPYLNFAWKLKKWFILGSAKKNVFIFWKAWPTCSEIKPRLLFLGERGCAYISSELTEIIFHFISDFRIRTFFRVPVLFLAVVDVYNWTVHFIWLTPTMQKGWFARPALASHCRPPWARFPPNNNTNVE